MNYCVLGIGSNLNNPLRQLAFAKFHLTRLPQTTLIKIAPYYRNPAWGKKRVPDYFNTVAILNTRLSPLLLLNKCQQIEKTQGRIRTQRYGARTIDIDMLYYERVTANHPRLILPHPKMKERAFVQIPLRQLLTAIKLPELSH